ncbi:nucleotidyltransferase domain-containing protein [Haloferax volcanii]|uniref:HTH domain protein n=3 Tax=Haloferax volcanii TaxID=2246 RepID=D4GR83_HALVD|nr:nucleotidyltransferase domain-containing protein [Haloferax volcanii]ADE02252.1 HTH domain protein [Haloferax volcanii DS2]ELY29209.1 Nucleotidyltransferase domain protein [Haloferax volcanii DS2]MBS8121378.1 nucleotidyltransferase domain-containing protein [Haloferax volcanii]MBS8126386.1 nucleotidyltransferase domain-containing protein [Haloferax volcanii]MBS8130253.1 nucleotidyltransferase domain-containing protein [Haloferax volcanii]
MSENTEQGINICVPVDPRGDTRVFRLRAADDVVRHLIDAHQSEFTLKELSEITDRSRSTVWRAVEFLEALDIVQVRQTTQRKYVSINPARLQKDDPVLGIPQVEYHAPVRAFVERVNAAIEQTDAVTNVLGILVFGSVARGEADRKSDIDVFVLVEGDRTIARRVISTVAADLGEERFDGDRYTFEPFVESEASARRASEKLHEIFRDGVTVYGDAEFQHVRTAVMTDE